MRISATRRTTRALLAASTVGAATAALVGSGLPGAAAADTGAPPTVSVGTDQVLTVGDTAFLRGRVSDDGLPDPSQLQVSWSQVSGPGDVEFGHAGEGHTTADFTAAGTYVLRLTVFDGGGTASDDLTVTVRSAPGTTLRVPADYPTIQSALNAAPAHGLVLVSPGTYTENLTVPRTLTLASTFYTTGDRSLIDRTVIHGASTSIETIAVSSGAAPDTHVVGFTVTGGKDGIKTRGAAVIQDNVFTGQATDAVDFPRDTAGVVKHNVMRGNGDDGVDVNEASVVIVDNLMEGNAGDGVETRVTNMVAPVDEVVIRGNRILGNTQDGLQIIDDDAIATAPAQSATLFTIDRNVIADNKQAGLGLMDGGTTSEDYRGAGLVERITVTNNTFDSNNHGIAGGHNLVAVNNVFMRHPNIALKNVDGSSRAAYNLFHANGTDWTSSNVDTATTRTGDPLLDPGYAPLPGSPVIDSGTAALVLPSGETAVNVTDYRGTAPDLGAVESTGGGGGTPANAAPLVDAGPATELTLPATGAVSTTLTGAVTDDGLPTGSTLTSTWSQDSGPATASFAPATSTGTAPTSHPTTTATFPAAGTYQLRLTSTDGQLTSTDTTTVTVTSTDPGTDPGTPTTLDARPATTSDDAEEKPSGSVSLTSSDLELTTDGSSVQTVGIRFPALQIPRNATLTNAWIQFHTDEVTTATTTLTLAAQATDNAPTFTTTSRNVSGRTRTNATVAWNPAAWTTKGEHGTAQRTPALTTLVQEVVNRPGWTNGNALAVLITGTGTRTAVAYDKSATAAPTLHVEFVTP